MKMKRARNGRFIKRSRKSNPRRRKHTARKVNPRRRRKSRAVAVRTTNPRRRRRRSRAVGSYTVRTRRKRRSNPRFVTTFKESAMPAIVGAIGALGMDIALGYSPLPVQLKTGWGHRAVQVSTALTLGWAASKFVGKQKGYMVGVGALTVVGYEVLRDLAAKFVPSLALGEYIDTPVDSATDPASILAPDSSNMLSCDDSDSLPLSASDTGVNDDTDGMGAYLMGTYASEGMGAYLDM